MDVRDRSIEHTCSVLMLKQNCNPFYLCSDVSGLNVSEVKKYVELERNGGQDFIHCDNWLQHQLLMRVIVE